MLRVSSRAAARAAALAAAVLVAAAPQSAAHAAQKPDRLPGARHSFAEVEAAHAVGHAARRLAGAAPPVDAGAGLARARALRAGAAGAPAGDGVVLTVSPPGPYTADVVNVTVAWTGLVAPNVHTDWVGQMCSTATDVLDYLEWAKASECADPAPTACALNFTIYRARCEYEFVLWRGEQPLHPSGVPLAVSNTVAWAGDPLAPFHVRVAYGGADASSSMYVSFTTNQSTSDVVVQLGTAPGVYDLPNGTDVESTTYAADDLCNANANVSAPYRWVWPGVFHHVLLRGLQPGTRYYARPVAGGSHAGPEATFVTGRPLGADVPTAFVGFGDMSITQYDYVAGDLPETPSTGPGAVGTARRVAELLDAPPSDETPAFVLHFGDLGGLTARRAVAPSRLSRPLTHPAPSALPAPRRQATARAASCCGTCGCRR